MSAATKAPHAPRLHARVNALGARNNLPVRWLTQSARGRSHKDQDRSNNSTNAAIRVADPRTGRIGRGQASQGTSTNACGQVVRSERGTALRWNQEACSKTQASRPRNQVSQTSSVLQRTMGATFITRCCQDQIGSHKYAGRRPRMAQVPTEFQLLRGIT